MFLRLEDVQHQWLQARAECDYETQYLAEVDMRAAFAADFTGRPDLIDHAFRNYRRALLESSEKPSIYWRAAENDFIH